MATHTTCTCPTFENELDKMAAAEQGDGWLCNCAENGQYLSINRQLVTALCEYLFSLQPGEILEVCAGRGELARSITVAGPSVVATDASPSDKTPVIKTTVQEALRQFCPTIVIGCFVPIDSGVDEAVLAFPSVKHYLVLGARLGGALGSKALWQHPDWVADPLTWMNRWMLTRHDVLIDMRRPTVIQHGEVWHLHRRNGKRRVQKLSRVIDDG